MPDLLREFVDVRKGLTRGSDTEEMKGTYVLTPEKLPILRKLAEHELLKQPVFFRGSSEYFDSVELSENDSEEIELKLYPQSLPQHGFRYFETFDDLVRRHSASLPERDFYVHDKTFYSFDGDRPEEYDWYLQTLNLVSLLEKISDHVTRGEKQSKRIFIYQKQKLVVDTIYSVSDLHFLGSLDDLRRELSEKHDAKQRKEIYRTTLVENLSDTKRRKGFRRLLDSFETLYSRYFQSYRRYLEEFSYEKLKSDFEREKLKYIEKLNKAITDIGNKLVATPVALLLVGGQFETEEGLSAENLGIVAGAFLFSFVLSLLIGNQKNALGEIEKDIEKLENSFLAEAEELSAEEEQDDAEAPISSGIKDLRTLHRKQNRRLNLFYVLVWSVAGLAVGLLAEYTTLWQKISSLVAGIF